MSTAAKISRFLETLRRLRRESETDPYKGKTVPIISSLLIGFLSGVPAPYWPSLFFASIGAAIAGFFSQNLRRALLSVLLIHFTHAAALSLMSGLPIILPLAFANPFWLPFLAGFSAIAYLIHTSSKNLFRTRKAKGEMMIGLILVGIISAIPAFPAIPVTYTSSTVSFDVFIESDVKDPQGLIIMIPVPLVANASETRIFQHPDPADLPDYAAVYDSSIVETEFGPAFRIDVKSLPYQIGPVYNPPPPFLPDTILYEGFVSFRMQVPYPSTSQTSRLELAFKTNITEKPYVGPPGSTYGGPIFSFKAPASASIPQGLKARVTINVDAYLTRTEPYNVITREDEYGEGIEMPTLPTGGWQYWNGTMSWRTLYKGPFSD